MARTRMNLLQRLMHERRLTRPEALKVMHQRAREMRIHDFALSLRQLDRWLAGDLAALPRPTMCRVVEAEFGHSVERLLAQADDALEDDGPVAADACTPPPGVRDLVSTAALTSARFGQWADSLGIGDLALAMLWSRLGQCARAYVHAPMAPVFHSLVALRDDLFEQLAAPAPKQTRDLYLLAGTACGLLAHASGNLGHLDAAQTQAYTALICAERADHSTLAAWVLGVRALQCEWNGAPLESLHLVEQAMARVACERVPGTTPAWLAAIEARSHARLGHHAEAAAALRRAEDNQEGTPGSSDELNDLDQIGGILTFTHAKQAFYAATAYRRIGDMAAAQNHAMAAIDGYARGPVEQRSYGDEILARIELSIARAAGDHPDLDGAAEALQAVAATPTGMRLPTLIGPLGDLGAVLWAPRLRESSHARGMRDTIEAIVASCQRRPGEVTA